MKKIIFFGAGRIGQKALEFHKKLEIEIDFFCDNAPNMQDTYVNSIRVISVEELVKMKDEAEIYITCKDVDTISAQLMYLGINEKSIHIYNSIMYWIYHVLKRNNTTLLDNKKCCAVLDDASKRDIIFELSNGLALGGVESWSLQQATNLRADGYRSYLLTEVGKNEMMQVPPELLLRMNMDNKRDELNIIQMICDYIIEKLPCVFVVGFASTNLVAACIAKHCFPNLIKIVSVVHNDEEAYYKIYGLYSDFIDICFVISSKMKQKLIQYGFPNDRIQFMPWEISCDLQFAHDYSRKVEPLRIGYAGRITVTQKRMDLLLMVIQKLIDYNIDFILEIAGAGDYLEEIQAFVQEKRLTNVVHLVGLLDRKFISAFWNKQDIMVSCSDWEGHSISQCEAMAAGVVPILTDVSGARDDVIDGVNGYIVDVGAVDQIVGRIIYLNEHRELLSAMGRKAYETMKEKYSSDKVMEMWETVLGGNI